MLEVLCVLLGVLLGAESVIDRGLKRDLANLLACFF